MKIAKVYTEDIEFQIILSFVLGLFFAYFSTGIEYTLFFVIIFELYVFSVTNYYDNSVKFIDRFNINLFFFFGWILARICLCEETGFEYVIDFSLRK